jgi:hypothetical protein
LNQTIKVNWHREKESELCSLLGTTQLRRLRRAHVALCQEELVGMELVQNLASARTIVQLLRAVRTVRVLFLLAPAQVSCLLLL